jgi:hypothetical protein
MPNRLHLVDDLLVFGVIGQGASSSGGGEFVALSVHPTTKAITKLNGSLFDTTGINQDDLTTNVLLNTADYFAIGMVCANPGNGVQL